MAILLSGDFDPDQMIATIDKYFGDMRPNENIPQLAFEPEAPITKPIVKEVYGPDAANVTLAWRTDNAASDDAEYLLLASRILYNGQAGMIDLDRCSNRKYSTPSRTRISGPTTEPSCCKVFRKRVRPSTRSGICCSQR